ncbi:MAG: hypothetical protein JWQ18_2504, partial [Conexibacter sp.]|nr:hypothetical protein [Conexibacter sp.]
LDAGCGTGYGTVLLAEAGAASISAFDVADEAVAATRSRVPDDLDVAVEVVQADIHELPFADGAFDLVVCFEVLEHVTEQPAALAELRRVLTTDGVLVISSPNRLVYPPGNPHHVHELTPDEFEAALREQFAGVALHRQHVWLASALLDDAHARADGTPVGGDTRLIEPLQPGQETYTVAVASDGPVPTLAAEVALAGAGELQWFRDRIDYLEGHLHEVEGEVHRRMKALEVDRGELAESEAKRQALNVALLELEARNAVLVDLERRFVEVREERFAYEERVHELLAVKDADFERQVELNRQLLASPSWRLTKPLRAVKRLLRR